MARIFISYKRVDKEKVVKIKNQIESALDEECWIDIDGIESDSQFANVIINAINNCEVFIFMYSTSHKLISDYENDWTIRELNFAQRRKKRIVFVNIDGSELADWFELLFGTKQQVDGTSDTSLERLINDLRKWLFIEKPVPNSQGKHNLPESLCFDMSGKRLYMVLSPDEKYYLGNIKSEGTDFSWLNNKWIAIGGSAAIAAGATFMGVIAVPFAIALFIKALGEWFNDDQSSKDADTTPTIVNKQLCSKLSKKNNFVFDVPTDAELQGVNDDAKQYCIVIRLKDNPNIANSQ